MAFVVIDSETKQTTFGRNIYATHGDVHEIVLSTPEDSTADNFSYVTMEPASQNRAVIMHKSSALWGCESGANDSNVVISRQLIASRDTSAEADEALAGDVIVRLVLERAVTSSNALDLITDLITRYGQTENNSFLICDPNVVWLLETSGKHWAAEQIASGIRYLSDSYTIGVNFDKHSDNLLEYSKNQGLWSGNEQFHFANAFNVDGCEVNDAGKLKNDSNMFEMLRSADLMPTQRNKTVMSSHVSTLRQSVGVCCIHWFTGTPDAKKSVFKPFIFTPNATISKHTIAVTKGGAHSLYQLHQTALANDDVHVLLRTMEANCMRELEGLEDMNFAEFDELMKDCVETEVKFYR